jgi:hypothetical protein
MAVPEGDCGGPLGVAQQMDVSGQKLGNVEGVALVS